MSKPKKFSATAKIQKAAPGPPIEIEIATPAILPIPIVPESAVAGGVFGTIIIGLRRSVQSNEAGTGAAAIVYATAQTKEPVSQGFVALLETFLTGVLCLFTSFAIVFSGACTQATKEISGIELASIACLNPHIEIPL